MDVGSVNPSDNARQTRFLTYATGAAGTGHTVFQYGGVGSDRLYAGWWGGGRDGAVDLRRGGDGHDWFFNAQRQDNTDSNFERVT